METLLLLVELIATGTLASRGRPTPVHVSWPVAALTFFLLGLLIGAVVRVLITRLDALPAVAASALVAASCGLAVYATRNNLGFPLSRKLATVYGASTAAGAALPLFLIA